eukprot:916846-Pelagomonas_calceolata.AAC.1
MLSASKIPMQEFIGDLRYRQHKVLREADALRPQEVNRKVVTDLAKGVMRNASRFRLRAHCLKLKKKRKLRSSSPVNGWVIQIFVIIKEKKNYAGSENTPHIN